MQQNEWRESGLLLFSKQWHEMQNWAYQYLSLKVSYQNISSHCTLEVSWRSLELRFTHKKNLLGTYVIITCLPMDTMTNLLIPAAHVHVG